MIRLNNVKKVFRMRDIETTAVSDVNLHVKPGEFLAIMGASGSGKSTLLNILGLLDTMSAGHCFLDGIDIARIGASQADCIRRDTIGFVFQNFNLIPELTVIKNVELALRYKKKARQEIKETALNVLRSVGMEARANHHPGQLSGGQQQRVAIARALASKPRLILADEPTGNLDRHNGEIVMTMLKNISEQGTTIIMVTHSEHQARHANRIVMMSDGMLSEYGSS